MSDAISEALVAGGPFTHGFTYSGHPTCAAAALANLDEIEERQLLAHVSDDIGPYLEAGLHALGRHPAVGEVRACGAIGALELAQPVAQSGSLAVRAAQLAREEGVIVRGLGDVLAVSPPLVIERAEIDILLGAIGRALDRLMDS